MTLIIFSSSVIPGNERSIQDMMDRLSRLHAKLITYKASDVHSSGHAYAEELRWLYSHINPTFFIPVHGYHYMLAACKDIVKSFGILDENIILPSNGSIIDIVEEGTKIVHRPYKMPSAPQIIDGNALGFVQETVLKERKILSEDGFIAVVVLVNRRSKSVKKSPDILSRGFIYLKDSQDANNKNTYTCQKVC